MFMVIAIYETSVPCCCQCHADCVRQLAMRKHGGMTEQQSGRDVIAQFLPQSPFVAKLGIVADQLADDEVRLRLPWDPSNVTVGDMVHGGAIATLADLTVMAAAWCGAEAPPALRGVTVSIALDFMAPARATDVIGVGRVLRRGRSLVNCEAEIVDPEGTLIAKAIATYKVG
jgi:uncharacterized protein (TIGR00369 family)